MKSLENAISEAMESKVIAKAHCAVNPLDHLEVEHVGNDVTQAAVLHVRVGPVSTRLCLNQNDALVVALALLRVSDARPDGRRTEAQQIADMAMEDVSPEDLAAARAHLRELESVKRAARAKRMREQRRG